MHWSVANPLDALSDVLRGYFSEPSDHKHTPVALVRQLDRYLGEYQAKQASRQRGSLRPTPPITD